MRHILLAIAFLVSVPSVGKALSCGRIESFLIVAAEADAVAHVRFTSPLTHFAGIEVAETVEFSPGRAEVVKVLRGTLPSTITVLATQQPGQEYALSTLR